MKEHKWKPTVVKTEYNEGRIAFIVCSECGINSTRSNQEAACPPWATTIDTESTDVGPVYDEEEINRLTSLEKLLVLLLSETRGYTHEIVAAHSFITRFIRKHKVRDENQA